MLPVASSGGVTIFCPDDGRYSFFNSPYLSHQIMTGVDIYSDVSINNTAQSPVCGKILHVRRVKAPPGRDFKAPDHDTVTIIGTNMPDRVVKILHVETEIPVGEYVGVGAILGPMIRSGYFGYRTPLHAHVEVRPVTDPLRVRGGYLMESLLELDKLEPTTKLAGLVEYAWRGYAQIRLKGDANWVVADVGGRPGILDGGIPLYGWLGTHVNAPNVGAAITLCGKKIGFVTYTRPRSCVAECTAFDSRINSTQVDLFFVLSPQRSTIFMATSKRRDELDLNVDDEVEVTIS